MSAPNNPHCPHSMNDGRRERVSDPCYACEREALTRSMGKTHSQAREIEKLKADVARLASYCRDNGEITTGRMAKYIGWSYSDVHAYDVLREEKDRCAKTAWDLQIVLNKEKAKLEKITKVIASCAAKGCAICSRPEE